MTRAKLLMIGLGLALVAVLAAPAAAQDGPTLTSDVTNVEAAGEQEFTITGAGWTAAPPIFVVPCMGATNLDEMAAAGVAACDLAALTPVTPEDGAFEVVAVYDVPAEGMCISASDAGSIEAATICITVGAAEEAPAEEAPAEEAAAEEEELADTGVESGLLAIIGLAVVGAGVMTVGYTRRFA
jgi:hypothetical protein